MEDIYKKLEKNSNTSSSGGRNINKRDWQILLIDDHGKIIPISHLKKIVVIVLSVLILSIISAATFFTLYINNHGVSYSKKKEIAYYKSQIKSLQNEVDILNAKMVLSESFNKTVTKDDKTATSKEEKTNGPKPSVPEKNKETDISEKQISKKEAKASDKPKTPELSKERLPKLEAKDFAFTHITYQNIMRIRFTIRNVDRRMDMVSGYIFLILKKNLQDPNSWLTIPAVDIVNGKPSQTGRGQYFKISNYKTVHLKLDDIENPQSFQKAELFIFDREGKVTLQVSEPVVIKTIEGIKPVDPQKNTKDEQQDTSIPSPIEEEGTTATPAQTVTVPDDTETTFSEPQDTPTPAR